MATVLTAAGAQPVQRVEWGPALAGALIAAALGTVMIAFGAAIGLSLTSPWPAASGLSAWATAIFVTYWTAMVQVLTFAVGGYLAARLLTPTALTVDDRSLRDGFHGLLVWALGVIFMAVIAAAGSSLAVSSASTVASGTAAGAGAAMGGPAGRAAVNPSDYAVDLLLRPVAGATPPGGAQARPGDDGALRADLGRVFAGVIRNRELTVRDRDYLAQVVATRTGAAPEDARRRVTEAVNEARDLEIRAREQADKARKATVVAGFTAAATLLIGLAAACAAGVFGGRQRDDNAPFHLWGRPIW